MNDLIADRWREYLIQKLQERYRVSLDVAANWTDEWLCELATRPRSIGEATRSQVQAEQISRSATC